LEREKKNGMLDKTGLGFHVNIVIQPKIWEK
jgi:hypothetical protein